MAPSNVRTRDRTVVKIAHTRQQNLCSHESNQKKVNEGIVQIALRINAVGVEHRTSCNSATLCGCGGQQKPTQNLLVS